MSDRRWRSWWAGEAAPGVERGRLERALRLAALVVTAAYLLAFAAGALVGGARLLLGG